jgi:hypothetical protein
VLQSPIGVACCIASYFVGTQTREFVESMADIFLSYANEDRDRAARLAGLLGSRGWSVWWDRKIVAGHLFDQVIERELGAAKCVVVLWSTSSVNSEWVKNEAAFANEKGVLVPAQIDRVKLPFEFRRRQTADLAGWDGDASHEGLRSLLDGISALAGAAPGEPAGHAPPEPGAGSPPAAPDDARPAGVIAGTKRKVDDIIVLEGLERRTFQIQLVIGAAVLGIGLAVVGVGLAGLRAGGTEFHLITTLGGALMALAGLFPFNSCLTLWQRIRTLRAIRVNPDLLGTEIVRDIVTRMYAKSLGV